MADETGPFEVEPHREPDSPPDPPSEPANDDAPSGGPEPHIDAESLLEGFDEDADFSVDPEVEAALEQAKNKSKKPDRSGEAELGDPSRWLVRPGFPSIRVSLIAGGVLTLVAVIFSIVNHADDRWWLHGFVTIYAAGLNTLLGLFALVSASFFCERGLNEVPLGLARMLVPVGGAMVALSLEFPYGLSMLLGAGAYYLLLLACFRLPKFELNILAITHFGLWLLVKIGIQLASGLAKNPNM